MFKRAIFPVLIVILCLAGLVASFTLAEEYYYLDLPQVKENSPAIFHRISAQACGDENSFFSCATVSKSRYANMLGVPLAIYGLFFYLVTLWLGAAFIFTPQSTQRIMAVSIFWVTLLGVVEAVVLLVVTLKAVKAICPLCLATYILNLLLFAAVATFVKRSRFNPLRPFATANPGPGRIPRPAKAVLALVLAIIVAAAAGVAREANAYLRQNKARYIVANKGEEIQDVLDAFARQTPQAIDFTTLPMHGPADAPVTIIEISDFLCPYCAVAADLLDQLAAANPERVSIRFVNLPLDKTCNRFMKSAMHKGSCSLALGAICAAEQGRLDVYQNVTFGLRRNRTESYNLRSILSQSGLAENEFLQCLRAPDTMTTLRSQIEQTHAHGISSTPTLFINRKKYQGRLSLEALQKIVDMETQAAR